MEIAGVVASMGQCLCGQCCSNEAISKQCSYLRKPEARLQILADKIKLLNARECDLITKLHDEKMWRGMDPTAEVHLWLDNVGEIKATVSILRAEMEENKSCLFGCFPNYYYRLKLGKNVSKKMHEADKLLDQSNFPESSFVNKLPEKGKILPTCALVGETAKRILQTTWEFLMGANTGIIGVYGMSGVGKTTIVKEINNKVLRENTHFDNIIWATASKDSNVQKLQKDIAKAMRLCFDEDDDEMTRASKLFEALLQRGKFLLIIDDMWEAFSLENIGIPIPTVVNGCKILITTRSLNVCHGMETDIEVEVVVLSEEDSWDLFKQKVGEEVLLQSSSGIQRLAKEVADECGGVPLALITIGRALRKEDNVRHWETALSELRNSSTSIQGMENLVFARLRFSYDRLKDDTTRSCFVYCALYPEDHLIETQELIKYWLWEGLLGTSQQGEIILNELKSACMLESVYQDENENMGEQYVKMHDLVRDMVIALTRANSSFMVKSGHGLRVDPPENEWSPHLQRVSLMRNDLSSLSIEPKCPSLCTLLLQYNSFDKESNPAFFNHILNLKVLDLSYTGIKILPESLSNLVNLHALLLCSCWNLSYVPTLAKLKELRALDLSYTSIERMPQGMEMLLNLQHLNLSYTNVLDIVSIQLLSNYRFLEGLFLIGQSQVVLGPIFLDVLASCRSLVQLEVNFGSMQEFDNYIKSGLWILLKNFKFLVGSPRSSTRFGKNAVGFFGVDICESSSPGRFSDQILELEINECQSITRLPMFITASKLQRCKIGHCRMMEWIMTGRESSTFRDLERLEIEGLSKLSGIYEGILPARTFTSLKVLHVTACNDLKTLLPYELAQNLQNLVEINIENCEKLAEVIGYGVNNLAIVLPKLRIMKLSSLPVLKNIYKGLMICDALSSLEVYTCSRLKTLPFLVETREQLLLSLKQIKGSKRWWKALRRNHRDAVNLLYPVFKEVADEHFLVPEDPDEHGIVSDGSASSSFGPR